MTCVVSTPWHSFPLTYGWSPMNPGDTTPTTSGAERAQYGYVSSESESRHVSGGGGGSKKRASRAGTRSVSTLSAAQLERKRANDREAQRAIRQRTKDHIEHLERNISDLRAANEASEKVAAVAHQRTRELEEENAYLRTKLGEVGYPMPVPSSDTSPSANAAGPSIPRPDSTSAHRSALSLNTSQLGSSRHGSWQQGPAQFAVTAGSASTTLPAHSAAKLGSSLTGWRSHDTAQTMHSTSGSMQDHHQLHTQPSYQGSSPGDRSQWATTPSYAYQEPQRTPSVPQSSPQPQQQYAQPSAPSYASQPNPPQAPSYVAPSQHEFQGMTVQSPAGYQVPQQQSYNQQTAYQMTHMQVSPAAPGGEYASQSGNIHPPLLPPAVYPTTQAEQRYDQQQLPQTMQYREDPSNPGFSLTHYPSG